MGLQNFAKFYKNHKLRCLGPFRFFPMNPSPAIRLQHTLTINQRNTNITISSMNNLHNHQGCGTPDFELVAQLEILTLWVCGRNRPGGNLVALFLNLHSLDLLLVSEINQSIKASITELLVWANAPHFSWSNAQCCIHSL